MEKIKKLSGYWKFLIIYILALSCFLIGFLIYINVVLAGFEASQPERIVEKQIELLKKSIAENNLEAVMPMSDELIELLGSDKYPESFKDSIVNGKLHFEREIGSYGVQSTNYNIYSNGNHIVTVSLESANERTEMIVFTRADWSLRDIYAIPFQSQFTLPSSILVKIDGKKVEGSPDGMGNKTYKLSRLGDVFVCLEDVFGNKEYQKYKVRTSFSGSPFTVPSNYSVEFNGVKLSGDYITEEHIKEFEYIEKYTEMPTLLTYNIKVIPTNDGVKPEINIKDNLGNDVEYKFGDKLFIDSFKGIAEVPNKLSDEAKILDFAEKWSLFMTNDLSGGLNTLSKYLIKGSNLYNVAYKWATGIDRTFTSIHRLYNPPFENEKIYNFVQYSGDCFSCDVYLVKKMRIANGLDVDDELSSKLFFVKYDATNNEKDDPSWMVVDMLGADPYENFEVKGEA